MGSTIDVGKVTEKDRLEPVIPRGEVEASPPDALLPPNLPLDRFDAAFCSAAADVVLEAWRAGNRDWLVGAERDLQDILAEAPDKLRGPDVDQGRGRAEALLEVVRGAIRRLVADEAAGSISPGSLAHRMLVALDGAGGLSNRELAKALDDIDETQISRAGRRLEALALAHKRRLGRVNWWELSPRGRQAVASLQAKGEGPEPAAAHGNRQVDMLQVVRRVFAEMASIPNAPTGLSWATLAKRTASALGVSESVAKEGVSLLANTPLLERGPRSRLSLRRGQPCAVGVSVNHDKVVGVLVDASAQALGESLERKLSDRSPEGVVKEIAALVHELVEGKGFAEPLGVGVELPGHVDGWRGEVRLSNEFGAKPWVDVDLAELIREATGFSAVVVENDANALALYERYFGLGNKYQDFSTVLVTERGIGAGIVLDGMLLRGEDAAVGEIGHIPIASPGAVCHCGREGCMESEVLSLLAAVPTASTVAEARKKAAAAGELLGRGIAVLLNILGSGHVMVVGSGSVFVEGTKPAVEFRAAVRRAVEKCGFSSAALVDPDWRFGSREHQARGAAAALLGRYRPSRRNLDPDVAEELLDALEQWGSPLATAH